MSRQRSRDYVFTLNNYTDEDLAVLATIECNYIVYGKEVGESGTPHLQGYVRFQNGKTLNAVKTLIGNRAHLERRRGSIEEAITYCKKDGDFIERGDVPSSRQEGSARGGEATKRKWREIIDLAEKGDLEEIKDKYPAAYFLHREKIVRLDKSQCNLLDGELQHEWHYGPPRTGKSKYCWDNYPNAYRKDVNKWWDGYVPTECDGVVVIEEWDKSCIGVMQKLKIWADRYPFRGEIKGTSRMMRPTKIIVTSNYSIRECCGDDNVLYDAVRSRFKVFRYVRMFQEPILEDQTEFTVNTDAQ